MKTTEPLVAYCAWCNRQKDQFNQAFGPLVPKENQRGTHGICNDCYKEMEKEMATLPRAECSFHQWLLNHLRECSKR